MVQRRPRHHRGSDDAVDQALKSFAELLRASPHNLLSPRGLEELEARHFPESIAFAATLPSGPDVLDIGSGGGIPGLVIAIARPDLAVHLLEATGKKAEFLAKASSELGLAVTVHQGRAEELCVGPLAGAFDIVTARAVAPMDRLVLWASPFLRVGGTLHAIKGDRWRTELEEAKRSLVRADLEVVSTPEHAIEGPLGEGPKVIVLRRSTGARGGGATQRRVWSNKQSGGRGVR